MSVPESWPQRARVANGVRAMLRERPGCAQIGVGWPQQGRTAQASFVVAWEFGNGSWRATAVEESSGWLIRAVFPA